jgi:tRNA(Arg) A34 adenosine deaminase TadA
MSPLDKMVHFKSARLLSYNSVAPNPGKRMGAVLHRGKKALAYGINSFNKTHPIQCLLPNKEYLHAEVAALLKRRHYDDIHSCEMTVYRETGDGKPAMAKPCAQCQAILAEFGIRRVYYSVPDAPYFAVMRL